MIQKKQRNHESAGFGGNTPRSFPGWGTCQPAAHTWCSSAKTSVTGKRSSAFVPRAPETPQPISPSISARKRVSLKSTVSRIIRRNKPEGQRPRRPLWHTKKVAQASRLLIRNEPEPFFCCEQHKERYMARTEPRPPLNRWRFKQGGLLSRCERTRWC